MSGRTAMVAAMLLVGALVGCTSVIRPDPAAVARLTAADARAELKRLCVGQYRCRVVNFLGCMGSAPIRILRFQSGESFQLDAGQEGASEVQYADLLDPVVQFKKPRDYWIELLPRAGGMEGLALWARPGMKGDEGGHVFRRIAEALASLKKASPAARMEGGGVAPAFAAGSGLTIAVAQFEPQGVSSGDAAVISDLFRSEMIRQGSFQVVEKANMEKVLQEQAFQQTGCTSQECAVKLGKILNVKYLVVGSFGKLLDRYVLNIRVVEIETARGVYSDNEQGKDVPEVQQGILKLATKLAGSVTPGK